MTLTILLHRKSPVDSEIGKLLDDAIAFMTWQSSGTEPHVHASVLIDAESQTIIEAFWPSVRRRQLSADEPAFIDVIKVECGEARGEAALQWLNQQIGKPYSIIDLLHFVDRIGDHTRDQHFFCSMLAAEFCYRAGSPLFARSDFFKISPGMIWVSTVGSLGNPLQPLNASLT
jgi:uncharacterized protein YycO